MTELTNCKDCRNQKFDSTGGGYCDKNPQFYKKWYERTYHGLSRLRRQFQTAKLRKLINEGQSDGQSSAPKSQSEEPKTCEQFQPKNEAVEVATSFLGAVLNFLTGVPDNRD